jgi:putative oxidoreductase
MTILKENSAEILLILFFIITYIFSATEKLADWKGTVIYYTNHFKGTILEKMIPLLLINIILFEIIVFILLIVGIYYLIIQNETLIAVVGLEISAIVLLMFLIGQRIAKDYAGAMNITVYFILNVLGIYLLT